MKGYIEYTEQDTGVTVTLPLGEIKRLESIETGCYITVKHWGRHQVLESYNQMKQKILEASE